MTYTLLNFALWFAIAAFIGGAIGWALRSLRCRGELARLRTQPIDDVELGRLRHRIANLEGVVEERDRLRIRLAELRATDSIDPDEQRSRDDPGAANGAEGGDTAP